MALEPFQPVNQTDGPPPRGWCQLFAYDGSSNLEYQGWAQSLQDEHTWSRDAATFTSVVVASDVASHGLQTGNRVVLANFTTAALNGTYIITVTSANAFTIATSGVADATYNNGGSRVSTRAPRTNALVWSIKKHYYSTNILSRISWAEGQPDTAKFAWDSKSTYAYQ
jgi:hypothetical protein